MLFATAFGGLRIGVATAAVGGLLGAVVAFGDPPAESARPLLLLIYVVVSGLIIWGAGIIDRSRRIIARYRGA